MSDKVEEARQALRDVALPTIEEVTKKAKSIRDLEHAMTSEPLCTYETRATDGECEVCGWSMFNHRHLFSPFNPTGPTHLFIGRSARCGHTDIVDVDGIPIHHRWQYGHAFTTEPVKEQADEPR